MLKSLCLGRVTYDINLVVDKMPAEGSKNEFFEKDGSIGGDAATVACCLARWGVNTSFAGVLGNDVNGTRVRKAFDKLHIDTRNIEPSYDNDTAMTLIIVNKGTRRNTIFNISNQMNIVNILSGSKYTQRTHQRLCICIEPFQCHNVIHLMRMGCLQHDIKIHHRRMSYQ